MKIISGEWYELMEWCGLAGQNCVVPNSRVERCELAGWLSEWEKGEVEEVFGYICGYHSQPFMSPHH